MLLTLLTLLPLLLLVGLLKDVIFGQGVEVILEAVIAVIKPVPPGDEAGAEDGGGAGEDEACGERQRGRVHGVGAAHGADQDHVVEHGAGGEHEHAHEEAQQDAVGARRGRHLRGEEACVAQLPRQRRQLGRRLRARRRHRRRRTSSSSFSLVFFVSYSVVS